MSLQTSFKFDFLHGEILLIDKPLTWTSFDVVNKVRKLIKYHYKIDKIKVGHAGTLDPMATGLLIICTGKATKSIQHYQQGEKEYTGTFYLGATTPSFDTETEVDKIFKTHHITKKKIREAAAQFKGNIEQIPPLFSAIQIKGIRAYKLARDKEDIELKSRKVKISEFDITKFEIPHVDFHIACSKGTYIRSLARDFGKELNSGAYLSCLKRTRIGEFKIGDALSLQQFENILTFFSKNSS